MPSSGGSDDTQAEIQTYRLAVNVPIPLSPRRFLILGASYQVDDVTVNTPMTVDDHRTFREPGVSAMLIQRLSERWTLAARAGVSLSGDFEKIDRRMLAGTVMALATYRLSPRLSLGGGALVTSGFGQTLPLPAFLVQWKPIDALRVELMFPAFARARYTLWNRFEFGGSVDIDGSNFAVRDATVERWPCRAQPIDDPMTSADESVGRPDACLDHVSYTVATASLLAGVRLTSSLWLTAYGGASVYRHADDHNRDGDTLEGGSHSLPNALFVRAAMTWRLPGS